MYALSIMAFDCLTIDLPREINAPPPNIAAALPAAIFAYPALITGVQMLLVLDTDLELKTPFAGASRDGLSFAIAFRFSRGTALSRAAASPARMPACPGGHGCPRGADCRCASPFQSLAQGLARNSQVSLRFQKMEGERSLF